MLDPSSASKSETANGHAGKVTIPGKAPIQIRETSDGVITLAGSTERSINTLKEMADCLEQGSLCRATGSTNMNNQSRFAMLFCLFYLAEKNLCHFRKQFPINKTRIALPILLVCQISTISLAISGLGLEIE